MADTVFTARAASRETVKLGIAKLELRKNSSGQYQHKSISTLITGAKRVLKGTYNPGDPGNGMMGLLEPASPVFAIKSTVKSAFLHAEQPTFINAIRRG